MALQLAFARTGTVVGLALLIGGIGGTLRADEPQLDAQAVAQVVAQVKAQIGAVEELVTQQDQVLEGLLMDLETEEDPDARAAMRARADRMLQSLDAIEAKRDTMVEQVKLLERTMTELEQTRNEN